MQHIDKELEQKAFLRGMLEGLVSEIERLKAPVVRLCGPITTGGAGYEENIKRFERAEAVMKEKGFSLVEFGPVEELAKEHAFPHEMWMEEFHKPLLESGKIHVAYFLPGWEGSRGSVWEKDFIEKHTNIKVEYFPEEWFAEKQ